MIVHDRSHRRIYHRDPTDPLRALQGRPAERRATLLRAEWRGEGNMRTGNGLAKHPIAKIRSLTRNPTKP
jgi:hypothetical protein